MEPNAETIALQKLASYCAYQERCHLEVRQRLATMDLPPESTERIIQYLIDENYLNQERFARAYVRGKFQFNHWGKLKIKLGLQQKEIDQALAEKAFATEIPQEAYLDTARELVLKKLNSLKKEDPWQKRNKIYRYMAGKGFESSIVSQVLADET